MRLSSVVLGLVAVLLFGGAVAAVFYVKRKRAKEERRAARIAPTCLAAISAAQADFRANDRDNNRVNDFWTGDVASLYYLNPGSGEIQLILKSVADADAAPLARAAPPIPFRGYLFRVLDRDPTAPPGEETYRTDTKGNPCRGAVHHPSRFGICAYPAVYGEAEPMRWTWVINENNTPFRSDTGGKPVATWPTDDEIRKGWRR